MNSLLTPQKTPQIILVVVVGGLSADKQNDMSLWRRHKVSCYDLFFSVMSLTAADNYTCKNITPSKAQDVPVENEHASTESWVGLSGEQQLGI